MNWKQTPTNWDTSRNWGAAPLLSVSASAGDTAIAVTGLGYGILPAGAVFFLAGAQYVVTADAVIAGNAAALPVDPPIGADAAIGVALTDFNVLCVDADLTQQDSVMPALSQRVVDPSTLKSAYDGKRALVKRDIASWLTKRSYDLGGITFPWDFNRAATFLELAYIYEDMSRRNEGLANEKALRFRELYQTELESVSFQYSPPIIPDDRALSTIRTTATVWRG